MLVRLNKNNRYSQYILQALMGQRLSDGSTFIGIGYNVSGDIESFLVSDNHGTHHESTIFFNDDSVTKSGLCRKCITSFKVV